MDTKCEVSVADCDPASSVPLSVRGREVFRRVITKLKSKRTWVATMFIIGTLDMTLNLVNLVQMSDPEMNYSLVIAGPTQALWISLCVFSVSGTLLYILESVNTFSVLYNANGDTIVPIHLELVVTLLFEHIPLAVTDYFVARCRRDVTTSVQSYCGAIRILFVFLRLVWYAHLEGKKIRKNDKYEVQQAMVMLCFMFFSVAMAFPIMTWRYEPKGYLQDHHLTNVTIYLLHREMPPEGLAFNIDITDDLIEAGWDTMNRSLVLSAWQIYEAYLKGETFPGNYQCLNKGTTRPEECLHYGAQRLEFQFLYDPSQAYSPYGEIHYNFAMICPTHLVDPEDGNSTCVPATGKLTGGWRVFYFETQPWFRNREPHINVSQPFRKAYTSPMPKFNPIIDVCKGNMDLDCTKTGNEVEEGCPTDEL